MEHVSKKFDHLLDQNQIPVVLSTVQTHVRCRSVGRGIEFEGALNQLMCEDNQSTMHTGQGMRVATIIKLNRQAPLVVKLPILRQSVIICLREKGHFLKYIVQRDSLSEVTGVTSEIVSSGLKAKFVARSFGPLNL